MKFLEAFGVLFYLLISTKTIDGIKCYDCHFWDGSDPSEAGDLNHVSCAKGNIPERRFMKVCNPGHICAIAYAEFDFSSSLNAITSRKCILPDKLIYDKCVTMKSTSDFDRLRKSSRLLKFDRYDKILNGTECGCSSQLCNSGSLLYNSVGSVLILTLLVFWISCTQ